MTIVATATDVATRACATPDPSTGQRCGARLSIEEGLQRCPEGHETINLEESKSEFQRQAEERGSMRPVTVVRWLVYDAAQERTELHAQLRRPDGSILEMHRRSRQNRMLRCGTEPLAEREIVYTHHAKEEMAEEAITREDVERVILTGDVVEQQAAVPVRMRGLGQDGRMLHACYRLNRLHQIVVITAMVERPDFRAP